MIGFILRHPIAVLLSVVLHVILVVLITFQWSESNTAMKMSIQSKDSSSVSAPTDIARVEPLQTFAVDSALVKQQLEKIKAQEEERKIQQQLLEAKTTQERQRLKELQKRQKEEQAKAEKARKLAAEQTAKTEAQRRKTELERQKTEEAKRLAKLEKQKAEAERIKATEAKQAAVLAEKERLKATEKAKLAEQNRLVEEKRKLALEKENAAKAKENKALEAAAIQAKANEEKARAAAALQRQLDEEAASQRAAQKRKQMLSLKETYISSISAKVKDNWRTPARISPEAQCDLQITQTPQGSVTSVKILNCNEFATKQFKQAAEKAVYRSEPIPAPPVKELFERVITFEFKP